MSTVSDTPIGLADSEGMRFAKLGLFLAQALDNAGIGYTATGYLAPISLSDSEGLRFAKLGALFSLLADNISGSGQGTAVTGVDATITSLANLAAIPTVGKAVPIIKIWVDASDLSSETWQLIASTAANNPSEGILRPDDYSASNQKVWFRRG